jgi:tetratricopeptide (TPR) repeat protein
VGRINGKDQDERAVSAERIAADIGADIVVYGTVDTTNALWQVTPEFYVVAKNFYEADEVIGQYGLGESFSVVGNGGTATRIALNDQLSHRVEVLARITVGLARYSFHHFDRALETFKSVEKVEGLTGEPGVQRVLYLLIGNAAGKNDELDLAEQYYTRSQVIDPEYARPYAGLGSVRYIQALDAFSKGITATARTKSEEAIKYYHEALDAPFKPSLADIESKAHFGLGRTYLLRSIMHQSDMSEAAQELQWVIDDYERSQAERLRERAAAAHASLGLIYRLSADDELAIAEYKQAIATIEDIPQLQDKLAKYYVALGDEYVEVGKPDEAVDSYQNAIELTDISEAVKEYQEKIKQAQSVEGGNQ